MRSPLDLEARRALLREAEAASRKLERKTAAEAATALAVLRSDGLGGLQRALDPSTQVELGAATKHWLDFRRALSPTVAAIASEHGRAGVAFFLGWLKRVAALSDRAVPLSVSGPAVPKLAAGDVVEAVLLDERTKKGGWKAQEQVTGRFGPIVNSDAVPTDRAPGDAITLVVASVSRTGVAFRYQDDAAPSP